LTNEVIADKLSVIANATGGDAPCFNESHNWPLPHRDESSPLRRS
jgi:hypothetical protein